MDQELAKFKPWRKAHPRLVPTIPLALSASFNNYKKQQQ
jgi:hypothetical protein